MASAVTPLLAGAAEEMRLGPGGSPAKKVIYVRLEEGSEFQKLVLYDGMRGDEVHDCLRIAARLDHDDEFLLLDEDHAIVPVSAALPAGLRVVLQRADAALVGRAAEAATATSGAAPLAAAAARGDAVTLQISTQAPRDSPALPRDSTVAPGGSPMSTSTPKTAAVKEMTVHTEAMKNFSKISNYLANDRTLLAWTRTSLALIRTVFAIAALAAASEVWATALKGVTISLSFLAVAFFSVGCIRFVDVREALDDNHPPKYMLHRLAETAKALWNPRRMMPVHVILGITVVLVSFAAGTKGFHK